MVKLKIARVAAAAAASAGLIASFSGVAGASSYNGSYDGGGCGCYSMQYDHHHHHNNFKPSKTIVMTDTQTNLQNNIDVSNNTDQNAYTGPATVNGGSSHHHNYGDSVWGSSNSGNGGTAVSGDATNSNSFNATVNATNTAPSVSAPVVPFSGGSKGGTTIVKTDTTTNETNNISVNNSTDQNAYTGSATVNGGKGGSAVSGDASNYNSTSVTVNATNK